ncbi:hypothetical protein E4633_01220 [Geomonas terrae]|uniref:Uncharacterized protein n=1 Tax=Geomonas terrae TaxID=2562681 RepID=A0A4S1CK68_9BACT|nr:hypothetical protein [Geomonas terrae]TGU74118.1 hypothetical protein E4633_01220 [Geomonas terrae]
MRCTLFSPVVVFRSLTVMRQISGVPLKNCGCYINLSLALQQGVHLRHHAGCAFFLQHPPANMEEKAC